MTDTPTVSPTWRVLSPLVAAVSGGAFAFVRRHWYVAAAQFVTLAALAVEAAQLGGQGGWADLLVSPRRLLGTVALIVVAALAAFAGAYTQWRDLPRRPRPSARAAVGAVLATALGVGGPVAGSLWVLVPQVNIAEQTFVEAPIALPSPLATESGTTTVPLAPGSLPRMNILLVGADAGPDRFGIRTDSMNIISLDPGTGDVAIIGVPRNLEGAPVPPGILREEFPDGYEPFLSDLYQWGDENAATVRKALGPTEVPGASLLAASMAELLGQPIHAWVVIDLAGFVDVIDAMGGVDIYVPIGVPGGDTIPNEKHPVPTWFEEGWHRMDGTDALAYARTRSADSDFERMGRQRCVLASLAAQTDSRTVATRWPAVSEVIAERVRTNLRPETIRSLLRLAGTDISAGRTLALIPPIVEGDDWDPAEIRRLTREVIDPPAVELPNAAAPASTSTPLSSTSTTIWAEGGASTIAEDCVTRR